MSRPSKLAAVFLGLLLVTGCAFKRHMKNGDVHLRAGRYSEALVEYEKALVLEPKNQEARAKVADAQGRVLEDKRAEAMDHLEAHRYAEAVEVALQVYEQLARSQAAEKLISEIVFEVNEQGDQRLAAGRHAEALALYEAMLALPEEFERVSAKISDARAGWIVVLEKRAEQAEDARRREIALLYYAKIAQLGRGQTQQRRRDALYQVLADEHRYVVAIKGKNRDGFAAVAGTLAGTVPGTLMTVLAPGKRGGKPAATLSFTLGTPRYTRHQTQASKSADYQSGTKQVPNPFYDMAEREMTDDERRLLNAEEERDRQEDYVRKYGQDVDREGPSPNVSTGAEQNLHNAKSRLEAARRKVTDQRRQLQRAKEKLRSTDRTKEEPVYSTHSYTVTTHTLRGTARLAGDLKPVGRGVATKFVYSLQTSASDEAHLAQNIARVPADRLVLPTQGELTARIHRDAQGKLQAVLAEGYRGYRNSHLDAARAGRDEAVRLRSYVIYILLHPAQVPPDVRSEVYELTGIDDAPALLGSAPAASPAS